MGRPGPCALPFLGCVSAGCRRLCNCRSEHGTCQVATRTHRERRGQGLAATKRPRGRRGSSLRQVCCRTLPPEAGEGEISANRRGDLGSWRESPWTGGTRQEALAIRAVFLGRIDLKRRRAKCLASGFC